MTLFIEKMLIFNMCRRGLMPNLIKKSSTVSNLYLSIVLQHQLSRFLEHELNLIQFVKQNQEMGESQWEIEKRDCFCNLDNKPDWKNVVINNLAFHTIFVSLLVGINVKKSYCLLENSIVKKFTCFFIKIVRNLYNRTLIKKVLISFFFFQTTFFASVWERGLVVVFKI
jgi:hypothetical protein